MSKKLIENIIEARHTFRHNNRGRAVLGILINPRDLVKVLSQGQEIFIRDAVYYSRILDMSVPLDLKICDMPVFRSYDIEEDRSIIF